MLNTGEPRNPSRTSLYLSVKEDFSFVLFFSNVSFMLHQLPSTLTSSEQRARRLWRTSPVMLAVSWLKTSHIWVRCCPSQTLCALSSIVTFLNFSACACVGRRGVFTGASGLQIAYVSGREALQEPSPAHCFTSKDLSALVAPLTSSSKFKGVDILLTSQWPRGVWHYGNTPVIESTT